MADDKAITFLASFPAIQSAIIISGDGTGLRIKLDIPETELVQSLSMLALRQTAFRVTIEPYEQPKQATGNETTAPRRTKAKRRK